MGFSLDERKWQIRRELEELGSTHIPVNEGAQEQQEQDGHQVEIHLPDDFLFQDRVDFVSITLHAVLVMLVCLDGDILNLRLEAVAGLHVCCHFGILRMVPGSVGVSVDVNVCVGARMLFLMDRGWWTRKERKL